MNQKIVVVGSANTDMVVQVVHLPVQGETVLAACRRGPMVGSLQRW